MTQTVVLQSNLKLQQVAYVSDLLADAIRKGGKVELSIPDDAQADLSFVQLVESARILAAEKGVGMTVASPVKGMLLDVLQRGGFLADGHPSAAFWLCGEDA